MTGLCFAADRLVDLDDIKLHLVEDIEHVVLKIGIGLIDLINEKDDSFVRHKGLPDLSHPDILFDVAHIPFRISKTTVIEACQGIVLIKGIDQLHARFDVQNDQLHAEGLCNRMGQHGLACSRFPFEEKRHFKGHRNVDDFGQFLIEHILRATVNFFC